MSSVAFPHFSTTSPVHRSPWHTPVPYLFAGLAAMLGLIAFALLVLACSYLNISSIRDGGEDTGERDLELGDVEKPKLPPPIWEEKVLVIMAGDEKPTFLATPISSRTSSFGSTSFGGTGMPGNSSEEGETEKQGSRGDHIQSPVLESQEALDHNR